MPQINVSKDQLKARPPVPAGIYDVRLDKFDPALSAKKDSVNLKPQMTVINHPTLNGRDVYEWLNSGAGFTHIDFCHAFGEKMRGEDDAASSEAGIPGEFIGPDDDPSKWSYVGPLLGKVGKIEIVLVPSFKDATKTVSAIKRYFCAVPGCQHKHSESLV